MQPRPASRIACAGFLCRPEIGLWAVAEPTSPRPASAEGARAILAALDALPAGIAPADLARMVRQRLDRENLRLHHRLRSDSGPAGVDIAVVLLSGRHILCLRAGDCHVYRCRRDGLSALTRPPPAETDAMAADAAPIGRHAGLRIATVRAEVDEGDRLLLMSGRLRAALDDGAVVGSLRDQPPDLATRALATTLTASTGDGAAVVVAIPPAASAAAAPLPDAPSTRASPALIAATLILALLTAVTIGLVLRRPEQAPSGPEASGVTTPATEVARLPGLSQEDLEATDRRLAQVARLAVAVAALDRALARLGLPPVGEGPSPAQPFAPGPLDARAQRLAARLPRLPLAVPLRTPYRLSSPFGMRTHPITGVVTLHAGSDFVAAAGTPIFATGSGRVVFADVAGGYGNSVEIEHDDGLTSRYAHLQSIAVTRGETVTAASVIGALGSTGQSTGPHLHYEIRRGGSPIDAMPFLETGQALKSVLTIALRH
jgi:murein DD-endopeptidase MepM/ murein hydrolase activator NlpD